MTTDVIVKDGERYIHIGSKMNVREVRVIENNPAAIVQAMNDMVEVHSTAEVKTVVVPNFKPIERYVEVTEWTQIEW